MPCFCSDVLSLFDLGGLEKHSADDLRRIFASKTGSRRFCMVSERLDWARTMLTDLEKITKEDLEEMAKEYLGAKKATLVTILPEA